MFSMSNADELRQRAVQSQKGKEESHAVADTKQSEGGRGTSGREPESTQVLIVLPKLLCFESSVDCTFSVLKQASLGMLAVLRLHPSS